VTEVTGRRAGLSRRGLLGAAAAAAWVSAGCGTAQQARWSPAPSQSETPDTPAPSPSGSPAPLLAKPIRTLADYRQVVPGPAFPANAVALTIDDGPHPVWTPKVLDLLEHHHVQATFCLIGNQVLGHEAVARSVAAAGHHLANHSYRHPTTLPNLPPERMHDEISRAQDKIYSTTTHVPKLFRSPGGGWSPPLLAQISQAGLLPLDWSEDPQDWKRPGTAAITQRMLSAEPGQILLCHDGGGDRSQTYTALQTVVPALISRGYVFVSL
jgi:peptidoglycan/xylan/chitin deacetylase (PgdA/CDA1 family)